jgi:translation initiation factor 1
MPKKKSREDRSRLEPEAGAPFNPAFAALAGLRPDAEPSPDPVEAPVGGAETGETSEETPADGSADPVAGARKLVVRREKKGRGGKTVTRIDGLAAADAETLSDVARRLGKALGCGARVEADAIIVQGGQSERVADWLGRQGARRVVIGDTPRAR